MFVGSWPFLLIRIIHRYQYDTLFNNLLFHSIWLIKVYKLLLNFERYFIAYGMIDKFMKNPLKYKKIINSKKELNK